VTYKGGHNSIHGSHYAHMHKPAVHHHAPAVHHPVPAASPKGSCESWQASRYFKPHLGQQHTTPRPQQCRSFRTQIKSTFCLYICLQKRTREFSEMGVPFLCHYFIWTLKICKSPFSSLYL